MAWNEDPARDWENHCADVERELMKYPKCHRCGERLTDYLYDVDGYLYCADCMDDLFRKDATAYAKEDWE